MNIFLVLLFDLYQKYLIMCQYAFIVSNSDVAVQLSLQVQNTLLCFHPAFLMRKHFYGNVIHLGRNEESAESVVFPQTVKQ